MVQSQERIMYSSVCWKSGPNVRSRSISETFVECLTEREGSSRSLYTNDGAEAKGASLQIQNDEQNLFEPPVLFLRQLFLFLRHPDYVYPDYAYSPDTNSSNTLPPSMTRTLRHPSSTQFSRLRSQGLPSRVVGCCRCCWRYFPLLFFS
jgi:hypothetical protein